MTDEEISIRIRVSPAFKAELDALWARKKISQQEALVQLLHWFKDQDDLLQSGILGQIDLARRDIVDLISQRMARASPGVRAKRDSA